MSTYFIDTDVLIDFLRGNQKARGLLLSLAERTAVNCCVVTVAELCAGMRESEEQATLALIDSMIVAPVTREIAEKAGQLKRGAKGYALELDDCLIAATAMAESAALVTRNSRHYPFDGLNLLVPEYS